MKKITLILFSFFIVFNGFSQDSKIVKIIEKKYSTGINIFTDIWQNKPDSMNIKTLNRGINIFGMYNIPIKESNFSLAVGMEICTHNLYSDSRPDIDSSGNTFFTKISKIAVNDKDNYKKNKLTVSFFDIPVELRLKTKNEFRFAVGFKAGIKLNEHTKYKGDDYINGKDDEIKFKEYNISNLETYRYCITGRIGYKWLNLTACYSLSKLFKKDKGPDMYPISVGISLIPYKN